MIPFTSSYCNTACILATSALTDQNPLNIWEYNKYGAKITLGLRRKSEATVVLTTGRFDNIDSTAIITADDDS